MSEGPRGTVDEAAQSEADARAQLRAGEIERALASARRACELAPSAQNYGTLGVVSKRAGLREAAIAAYRTALTYSPEDTDVLANLGRALREQGDLAGAVASFRAALRVRPALAEVWSMLSNAEREAGDPARALASARRALARKPELGEAHLNEAAALCALGRFDDATASAYLAHAGADSAVLDKVLHMAREAGAARELTQHVQRARDPACADGKRVLGRALLERGRLASAVYCLTLSDDARAETSAELIDALLSLGLPERALQRALPAAHKPDAGPALLGALGRVYIHLEKLADAEPFLRRALALDPADVPALHNLGTALQRRGRPIEASALYRRALALAPALVETRLNLGVALADQAEHGEAVTVLRGALALAPERADLHSNLLFAMHFDPALDSAAIFTEHRAYAARFEPAANALRARPARAGRALRVGYVSPDLRGHPVANFLAPVLAHHDPRTVHVTCYSDTARPDATTARLARMVPNFRHTQLLSDDELGAQIQADQIDVLIDLAGHTGHNRLRVFACKLAALQLSWIGYFDTTGLDAIDYRIVDRASLPEDTTQAFSERIYRMPRTANCYEPPQETGEVARAPLRDNGFVTFGCFNNPAKITRTVAHTFAEILARVPGSRLLLKYGAFDDAQLRARYLGWFSERGLDGDRVSFEGHTSMRDFMASFARIDLALDPFPYSGETTALHTLWMGVPVLAIEGDTLVQRLASRVLRIAGFHELVATSREEYVVRAVRLATDQTALSALRHTVRPRLAASALMDHAGFTREFEAALCAMWDAP